MHPDAKAIAVIDLGDFSDPDLESNASRFALRKLCGQSLVMRMARRISECAMIDEVVIVGSRVPANLLSGGLAGVRMLNLPTMHFCQRACAAADDTDAEWIVYLPANRPFVDAVLIDRLVAQAKQSSQHDYVGYGMDESDRVRIERLGLAGEACHVDTMRRLRRHLDNHSSGGLGQTIAECLCHVQGVYQLKFIPIPRELDRDDLRFTVADESDWDDVELLCETIPNEDSQWPQLTQLMNSNAALRNSMATRNAQPA